MELKIIVKSYYASYLNNFITKLKSNLNTPELRTTSKTVKQIILPSKTEKYTVLRSPHADKKSREQFERKTHKRLILLNVSVKEHKQHVPLLYNFFQKLQNDAIGVEYYIYYNINFNENLIQ